MRIFLLHIEKKNGDVQTYSVKMIKQTETHYHIKFKGKILKFRKSDGYLVGDSDPYAFVWITEN